MSGGVTGTHVDHETGKIADDNARDNAILALQTYRDVTAPATFAPLDARDTSITAFAVGQLVVSGTSVYKVTTAHAAPFDSTKATSVGGGGGTVITATQQSVADFAALRAASTANPVTLVLGIGSFYYDSASTLYDDGVSVIQPTAVTGTNPGRWLRRDRREPIRPFGRGAERLVNARAGIFRVLQVGTSIANFDNSCNRVFVENLRDIYGDAREQVFLGATWGGDFSTPRNGWVKQNFGGLGYTRMRGQSSSTALTVDGYFDTLVVEYSKESDGGSWNVQVDGVTVGTINSNGAQAYGLQASFTVTAGPHRVSLVQPASGYSYMEAVRLVDSSRVGVATIDMTRGGSALGNSNVFTTTGTTADVVIPVVGTNGIDGIFGRTDVDLVLLSHLVNDAGQLAFGLGWFNSYWKPDMDRLVALTAASDTPVVVIVEPAGHNIMPAETNTHDQYNTMREYLLQLARDNPHVYALDWHGMTAMGDIAAYAAMYYSVSGLNTTTGAYTGDFIHPNTKAQRTALGALCQAFGVPMPTYDQSSTGQILRDRKAPSTASGTTATVDGLIRLYRQAEGTALKPVVNGTSSMMRPVPYYRDNAVPNETIYMPEHIAASGTSDAYGTYLTVSNGVVPLDDLVDWTAGEKVRITARVKGAWVIRAFDTTTGTIYNGTQNTKTSGGTGVIQAGATDTIPIVVTFEFSSTVVTPSLQMTGDFYEFCVTRSTVPLLTTKPAETFKRIGPPTVMVGDQTFDETYLGQHYYEDLGSSVLLVKKLVGRVRKWDPTTQTEFNAGLYEAQDRTVAAWKIAYATGTPAASSFAGGQAATNPSFGSLTFGNVAINVAGKLTICYRPLTALTGLRIQLAGSSNYYLQPDGTWTTTAASARAWTVGATLIGSTLAFTFDIPTSLAGTIGSTPGLNLIPQGYGAGTPQSAGTLVKGSSACV